VPASAPRDKRDRWGRLLVRRESYTGRDGRRRSELALRAVTFATRESLRQELQPDIRVTVIEPGAVATELTSHITHDATKEATEDFVRDLAIRPEDIAEVIAFAVSRPRRMTLNEILVRPTAQAG